jgi:hypothetical protein
MNSFFNGLTGKKTQVQQTQQVQQPQIQAPSQVLQPQVSRPQQVKPQNVSSPYFASPQTTQNVSQSAVVGGAKVTYKGRKYIVRKGPQGGKFILVKGKKVYVS